MSTVTLRHATIDDKLAIEILTAQAIRFHSRLQPHRIRPAVFAVFDENELETQLADSERHVMVAEVDGQVIGLLSALIESSRSPAYLEPRAVYVEVLIVNEEYRLRGIGSQLLESALTWAEENGIGPIRLNILPENKGAHAFYGKFGFGVVGLSLERRINK
jgi:ribosomal protein S18 acetylase RimI-like enzyme